MTIKMNYCNRPIGLVETPQQGKGNGMVAAHGDDAREGFSSSRETVFIGVSVGFAHEEAVVALFNLLDCPCVIIPVFGYFLSHFILGKW